jgi:hypothetical protein
MSAATLLREASALGVRLQIEGDRITVDGPRPAVERLLPALREHKQELLAALAPGPELFAFAPPAECDCLRDAIEERAAIIAEGCGMEHRQALREARWRVEQERALAAFQRNAERILAAPGRARAALLARYEAEAAERYGARVARNMAATLRGWTEKRDRGQRG